MNFPKFELARILTDGTEEETQIFPVEKLPLEGTTTNRRGFIGAGLTIAAVLGMRKLYGGTTTPDSFVKGDGLRAHDSSIESLHFSNDGKILLSIARKDIKLWSMPRMKYLARIEKTSLVWDVAISPDNQTFAIHLFELIEIRSLRNGSLIKKLEAPTQGANPKKFIFTVDGKRLLVYSDGTEGITCWECDTWEKRPYFPDSLRNIIMNWGLSPDGKMIITAEKKISQVERIASLKAYSVVDGKLIKELEKFPCTSASVRLLVPQDGKRFFFINKDNSSEPLQIWNLKKLKKEFFYKIDENYQFAVSPQGDKIFTNSSINEVAVWEAPLLSENQLDILDLFAVPDYEALKGHLARLCVHVPSSEQIQAIATCPTSTTIASGDSTGVIKISDWSKNECLGSLFDPKINEDDGISYNVYDKTTGHSISYTMPCGSQIPAGAVCTCNCVAGTKPAPRPQPAQQNTGSYCSCNKVCTCVPVYTH